MLSFAPCMALRHFQKIMLENARQRTMKVARAADASCRIKFARGKSLDSRTFSRNSCFQIPFYCVNFFGLWSGFSGCEAPHCNFQSTNDSYNHLNGSFRKRNIKGEAPEVEA